MRVSVGCAVELLHSGWNVKLRTTCILGNCSSGCDSLCARFKVPLMCPLLRVKKMSISSRMEKSLFCHFPRKGREVKQLILVNLGDSARLV